MAVGTVSGINDDVWQSISSQTVSNAATITFSSLSGYKRYMVVWKNVPTNTAQFLRLRINGDNTAGNYASTTQYVGDGNGGAVQNAILLDGISDTSARSGLIVIEDADKSAPHQISNFVSSVSSAGTQAILNAVPITQIEVYVSSGVMNSGTIQLWGVAA